jgi:adenosine kinase
VRNMKSVMKPSQNSLFKADIHVKSVAESGILGLVRDNPAHRIPSIPTENVVDPTGAGDAFRGGLIKGLIQGYPIERAAMLGTVCAHFIIQSYGTQEYSFTREEFAVKLKRHFGVGL